jgi:hypothetical protein
MAPRPPYSTTFIQGSLAPALPNIDYTVPAGFVALVSNVDLTQTNPAAASYAYCTVSPTGTVFTPFFARKFAISADINDRGWAHWTGHIAVPAGGKIRVQILAASSFSAVVAGYLLNASP